MKCPKCGKEIRKKVKFCPACGASLYSITRKDNFKKKRDMKAGMKTAVLAMAGIFGAGAVGYASYYLTADTRVQEEVRRQITLGASYLESGEYESAEVAFNTAFLLDPESGNAAISLAEDYNEAEDPEQAQEILNIVSGQLQGMEEAGDYSGMTMQEFEAQQQRYDDAVVKTEELLEKSAFNADLEGQDNMDIMDGGLPYDDPEEEADNERNNQGTSNIDDKRTESSGDPDNESQNSSEVITGGTTEEKTEEKTESKNVSSAEMESPEEQNTEEAQNTENSQTSGMKDKEEKEASVTTGFYSSSNQGYELLTMMETTTETTAEAAKEIITEADGAAQSAGEGSDAAVQKKTVDNTGSADEGQLNESNVLTVPVADEGSDTADPDMELYTEDSLHSEDEEESAGFSYSGETEENAGFSYSGETEEDAGFSYSVETEKNEDFSYSEEAEEAEDFSYSEEAEDFSYAEDMTEHEASSYEEEAEEYEEFTAEDYSEDEDLSASEEYFDDEAFSDDEMPDTEGAEDSEETEAETADEMDMIDAVVNAYAYENEKSGFPKKEVSNEYENGYQFWNRIRYFVGWKASRGGSYVYSEEELRSAAKELFADFTGEKTYHVKLIPGDKLPPDSIISSVLQEGSLDNGSEP